ncbi:MAG: ImmA/IrrE family metallo-endopeptidase [Patescibacteria group bacterium]
MDHFAADVLGIAKSMGAKVIRYDFEGKLDGVIVRIGGRPYVGIDRALGIVDARFTIAHELGHVEDDTVGRAFTLIAERRADRIAREKLIPERELFAAVGDYG